MPYNPSSAYPRHSTYTPPVEGRGFARGFNEIEWGKSYGRSYQMPGADVGHALRAAGRGADTSAAAAGLQAQGRRGMVTAALAAGERRAQRTRNTTINRKAWNRAEQGDDPNEIPGVTVTGPSGPLNPTAAPGIVIPSIRGGGTARERTPTFGTRDPLLDSGPAPTFGDPFAEPGPSQTGGRPHVGPPNDRLGAIAQRVVTSSVMNDTVNRVLSGKIGGPLTVPKLVFGAARAANRRRKGGGGPAPTRDPLPF